ncbi:Vesicle tethering protein, partial [Globisporangium splendens]
MQAVISRVHRIVTAGSEGDGSGSAPSRSPSAAAAAMSALGGSSPSPSPAARMSPTDPSPVHRAASPAHVNGSSSSSTNSDINADNSSSSVTTASETQSDDAVPASVMQEIELAVERLQYATLLGERKKATEALRDVARGFVASNSRRESPVNGTKTTGAATSTPAHRVLGETAIPVVLNALISDPRDTELMEAMLEFLQELITTSPTTATSLLDPMHSGARGGHSSFSMRGAPTSGVQICLQLLQDPSPWIRGPTITLVKCIQEAKQKEFAAAVLECKEGLRRLLEVVEDKRDHIRDAALQVLVKLTEREKIVQQFLAFEDGFVRLFQIMEIEGLVEGSSVISDCLQIVNNMVRDNLMTQTLLRELPHLESHLPQLLRLPSRRDINTPSDDDDGAVTSTKSYQKKRALKLGLQLVRFLVAGLHEGVADSKLDELALREKARKDAELGQIQSFIGRQTELMGAIGEIACCQNEELTDLQLQALDLLELLGSSNGGNQVILVNLQSKPSHLSVLSEFVRLDFAEEETPVSVAAASLLDSLFRNNETTKMAIFQQLNAPPPIDDQDGNELPPTVPAGCVLLDGLIKNAEAIMTGNEKNDALRFKTIGSWKACHRLTSLLTGSDFCKELALRIPSEYENSEAQAVAGGLFLTRCLRLLSSSSSTPKTPDLAASIFQIKVGVLCLLIQWSIGCTKAVREIVGSVANLSILVNLFVAKEDQLSPRSTLETTHLRGLVAMLLGCCLEYLVDARQQELPSNRGPPGAAASLLSEQSSSTEMTREQLLELISKRIGLERFTDAFIQFQQSPQVIACARGSKNQSSRNLLPQRTVADDGGEGELGNYLFAFYEKSFIGVYREMSDRVQKRIISIYTCAESGAQDGGASSNAMSAYQDLIRIQDKQLHDLEKQLADLKNAQAQQQQQSAETFTQNVVSGGGDALEEAIEQTKAEMNAQFAQQLEAIKHQHNQEKSELEGKIKTMEAAALAMETRFNGLSVAFEQLEVDHQKQGEALELATRAAASSGSIPPDAGAAQHETGGNYRRELETLQEKCALLEYELHEEKELRVQGEKHFYLDRNELEMHLLRLQKEIEDLRMSLSQRDEQIQENNQMLEALEAGQAVLKKENTKLKEQLENSAHAAVPSENSGDASQSEAEAALHKEIEHLSKELVSKQSELDLARETHRGFERRFVSQLQGETAKEQSDEKASGAENQASEAVDQVAQHGAAREIFKLLEKQRAKSRELKQTVESLTLENGSLKVQVTASQEERDALQARLDEAEIQLNDWRLSSGESEEAMRLKALIEKQLEELQELRSLVDKMEALSLASTKELEAKNDEIVLLQKSITDLEAAAEEQKAKLTAKLAELESKLGQGGDTRGKSKSEAAMNGVDAPIGTPMTATPESNSTESTLEDAYMLLASLEIHCGVLREKLREARGDEAVLAATQASRLRGAITM